MSETTVADPREWADPLYRPRTGLPAGAEVHSFGEVTCAVVVTDTDPDSAEAQWMADRTVALSVSDEVSPDDLHTALPEFLAYAATLADRPTEAALTLPSRAVDHARTARGCGLTPQAVLAVADPRRVGMPSIPAGLNVRDASNADSDAVTRLWWEQADYESRVGTLRISPAIRASIAADVAGGIASEWITLVAERAGEVLGAVVALSPASSEWAGTRLAPHPVSYLSMASTAASARGGGVGAALVGELHERHVGAGVVASVLHYSAYNPLSIPFWSQRGYRPLLTTFARAVGESAGRAAGMAR